MLKLSTKISKKGLPKELAVVTGFNIKPIEHESFKSSLFTRWGLFVDLVLESGTKITCIWKLYKTGNNTRIFGGTDDHFSSSVSISYILRSLGVLDLNSLIDSKIKVRRTSDSIRVRGLKKDAADNTTGDKSKTTTSRVRMGFWSFPDMFEYSDIATMTTEERMDELISLFPDMKEKLESVRAELLGKALNTPNEVKSIKEISDNVTGISVGPTIKEGSPDKVKVK